MASETICHEPALAYEASTGEKLRIVCLPNGEGLAAHRDAWWDLSASACEGNVFYEPFLLEPAIAELRAGAALEIVLIYQDGNGRAGRLCGLFPLERRRPDRHRPLPSLALWKHVHCFLCTPLVRADVGAATLEAFSHWLRRGDVSAQWMAFEHIGMDGPFARLLDAELDRRGARSIELERFERALVETDESADVYLRAAMSGKRRREVERHQRKLDADGGLQFRMLAPGDGEALECWLDEFLALESSGWKGRSGTAITSRPEERSFFRSAARSAFESGRLMMLAMDVAGRPVAMKCNFLTDAAQAGGFAFKIAFDEALSRHSPGVVLEFENLERIHTAPRLAWMDSCAKVDHPMLDRMWRQRRVIADVLTPTGRAGGSLGLRAFEGLRRAKHLSATMLDRVRGRSNQPVDEITGTRTRRNEGRRAS